MDRTGRQLAGDDFSSHRYFARAVLISALCLCKLKKPRRRPRLFHADREPAAGPLRCPASVHTSPDISVEELAHRRGAHQVLERWRRQTAILVVDASDAHDQGALRPIVADPLDEAAAVDVPALERSEIDQAAIPHIDGFGAELRVQ